MVLDAAFQLYQEETKRREDNTNIHGLSLRSEGQEARREEKGSWLCDGGNGLAVPVVDLLDVSKDYLVFAPHVLRDPSNLQAGHEALGCNKRLHH